MNTFLERVIKILDTLISFTDVVAIFILGTVMFSIIIAFIIFLLSTFINLN